MARDYILGGSGGPVYVSDTRDKSEIVAPGVYLTETTSVGGTAYTLTCSAGSITYVGAAATLKFNRAVVAAAGGVVYAGVAATLRFNRAIVAGAGSVTYQGIAATLTKTTPSTSYVLTANPGSITLAGVAATLTYHQAYRLTALLGTINYAGARATLRWSGAPPEAPLDVGGKGKGRPTRRRRFIEFDNQLFEVHTEQDVRELIEQARELARKTAAEVAEKAVRKAIKAKTPAAKTRALQVPMPRILMREPLADEAPDEFTQWLRAQVDAVRTQVEGEYTSALREAQIRILEQAQQEELDQQDLATIQALDVEEDMRLVMEILKTTRPTAAPPRVQTSTRSSGKEYAALSEKLDKLIADLKEPRRTVLIRDENGRVIGKERK